MKDKHDKKQNNLQHNIARTKDNCRTKVQTRIQNYSAKSVEDMSSSHSFPLAIQYSGQL